MADSTPWYRSRRGPPVVLVYAALTVFAAAISTGWLVGSALFPDPGADGFTTRIPPFIYLYAFLGGMAYAFTSIIAKFERGVPGVLRVGLRALAALPLAAGIYLLAGALGFEIADGRLIAGLAFLVGLYVNVSLKALGGLAEQLYGRTSDRDVTGEE